MKKMKLFCTVALSFSVQMFFGCINPEPMVGESENDATISDDDVSERICLNLYDGTVGAFSYEIRDSLVIVEGDMAFPMSVLENQRKLHKTMGNYYYWANKWEKGIIPYRIITVDPTIIGWINTAINQVHSTTGIRFVPAGGYDSDVVEFRDGAEVAEKD